MKELAVEESYGDRTSDEVDELMDWVFESQKHGAERQTVKMIHILVPVQIWIYNSYGV